MNTIEKLRQLNLVKTLMLYLGIMNIFAGLYLFYLGQTGGLSHMGAGGILVLMLATISIIVGIAHLILGYLLSNNSKKACSSTVIISFLTILFYSNLLFLCLMLNGCNIVAIVVIIFLISDITVLIKMKNIIKHDFLLGAKE